MLLAKRAGAARYARWLSGAVLGSVRQGMVDGKHGRSRALATMIATRTAVADPVATARILATMKPTRGPWERAWSNNKCSALRFLLPRTHDFALRETTRARARATTRDSRGTHHLARSAWACPWGSAVRSPQSALWWFDFKNCFSLSRFILSSFPSDATKRRGFRVTWQVGVANRNVA